MARRRKATTAPERSKATGPKTQGRRGRRRSRFTPRRWLPFLAMIALIAGAVVVISRGDEPAPKADSPRGIAARLPVASASGALSTAWYCGGGTARGDGPVEMTVIIANSAAEGAQAEITAVDPDGKQVAETVDVPARGTLRMAASDLMEATWVALTVEVFGGRASVSREVTGSHGFDLAPCSNEGAERWYVPSGSTVRGASETLMLFNPYATATSVDVSFATDEGPRSPRGLRGLSIPAGTFRLVSSEELPARRPEIATTVIARTGRVVVDRVQSYDGSGDPVTGDGEDAVTTPAPEGLVSTPAISTVSTRWVFPDAQVGAEARLQVAIYNPGRETAEIDLGIGYEYPDRAPIIEPLPVTVRGGEQRVVDLTDAAAITLDTPFSIDLQSLQGVPVVAEQLIFGAVPPADLGAGEAGEPAPDDEVAAEEPTEEDVPEEDVPEEDPAGEVPTPSRGLAVTAGAPIQASTWFLTGHGASDDRAVSVVVANVGTRPARVRVQGFDKGSRTDLASATVEVPAGDRRRLDLAEADERSALLVLADGPVVVGRTTVTVDGLGVGSSLLTPWPETVVPLPPLSAEGS